MAGILGLGMTAFGQVKTLDNAFWDKVDYIGAFGTEDWTAGWANYTPQQTDYPATRATKGNGNTTVKDGEHITAPTTWAKGVYKLSGWVVVDSLQTLTIEAGTIVRGDSKSAIIVKRGGKLIAEGTKDAPIVFTTNIDKGSRTNYDWGGIIICGAAPNNNGVTAQYEGIADLYYGGGETGKVDDNSGSLKYVRVEFACLDYGNAKEINALTFCSVGNGTKVDYVQVSNAGDDGYEFFGGSVNAKHLVSFKTEDDDFDTDNGWSGMVQFAVALRDPKVVDSDAGRTFESDNDATGSDANPRTNGTFSNVTSIGPKQDSTWTTADWQAKYDAALYLRRNTELKVWNSLMVGTAKGLIIESDKCAKNAKDDKLQVKFTSFVGVNASQVYDTVKSTSWSREAMKTWFDDNGNKIEKNIWDCELENPFSLTAPKFVVDANIDWVLQYPRNKSCWTDKYVTFTAPTTADGETLSTKLVVENPVGNTIESAEELVIYSVMGIEVARGKGTIDVSSLNPGSYVAQSAGKAQVIIKK